MGGRTGPAVECEGRFVVHHGQGCRVALRVVPGSMHVGAASPKALDWRCGDLESGRSCRRGDLGGVLPPVHFRAGRTSVVAPPL